MRPSTARCANILCLSTPDARRPLTSRSSGWARRVAAAALQLGLSADSISVLSLVFTALGAIALFQAPPPWNLLLLAVGIQLRLLCNLIDGMVAVEGGRKSAFGALYNEVPDRLADSVFLVALGYYVDMSWLGWFGALAAAVTAYIRVLGGALGLAQDFRGPMAKPHRMATISVACLIAMTEYGWRGSQQALVWAAWLVALGSVLTCGTRLRAIARQLRDRAMTT